MDGDEMLSSAELMKCSVADFSSAEVITDLREVQIDSSKPVAERVESFLTQVGNPYLFKVGDVTVKVNYKDEKELSASLITLLSDG